MREIGPLLKVDTICPGFKGVSPISNLAFNSFPNPGLKDTTDLSELHFHCYQSIKALLLNAKPSNIPSSNVQNIRLPALFAPGQTSPINIEY